jgi:nicotinamidase/pyrazinamidase
VKVFFDIDTQIDFLYPAGALYVPGAESIVENIARLNRHAAAHQISVISTTDAHSEHDPEFRTWPPHCVVDTAGQQKSAATLLERRVIVPNTGDMPDIAGAVQIIIEKQTLNCFDNAHLVPIVDSLGAEECVVYGVVTEICVKIAAMGLLKTGRKVEVVTDAVRSLNDGARDEFFREFQAAGGTLTTVEKVTSDSR